jgi:hypothetical protein
VLLKVHLAAVLGLAALLAILTWLVFIPAATSVERMAGVEKSTWS